MRSLNKCYVDENIRNFHLASWANLVPYNLQVQILPPFILLCSFHLLFNIICIHVFFDSMAACLLCSSLFFLSYTTSITLFCFPPPFSPTSHFPYVGFILIQKLQSALERKSRTLLTFATRNITPLLIQIRASDSPAFPFVK